VNTKDIGMRSEGAILSALMRLKGFVLLPLGENQRYDMVFMEDGRWCRVQCKTGRLRGGAVVFNTASIHGHRGKPNRSYRGEIEYFGVFCPAIGKTYLIPIDDVKGTAPLSLRIEPTRNNQKRKIRWADQYEIN
jgi:hypothetical protein